MGYAAPTPVSTSKSSAAMSWRVAILGQLVLSRRNAVQLGRYRRLCRICMAMALSSKLRSSSKSVTSASRFTTAQRMAGNCLPKRR